MLANHTPASRFALQYVLAILLFASIAVLTAIHDYLFHSFISLFLLIIFLFLAYPFSIFLFGRGEYAILFTLPIGYILHAVGLSIFGIFFGISKLTFVSYFVVFAISAFFLYRKLPSSEGSAGWNKTDWILLFLWLFCTFAVLAVPYTHVGFPVSGGHAYRAYFNTDFFRHMAVAANLANHGIPPENPYFNNNVLRYYWFFHIIPAYWIKLLPSFSLPHLMVQFHALLALMFSSSLYIVIRHFTELKRVRILLLPLFLFGGSYEGMYLLIHFFGENLPWITFREWNVDAVLRWLFRAPQVDTLFRGMLYGPQHMIGLITFILLLLTWKTASTFSKRLLLYVLLFSITGFTVIIAGVLILGYATLLLLETIRDPRAKWKELLFSAVLGLSFLAAYFFLFQMFGTKGGEVQLQINYFVLANIAKYIPLNWGAILIAGVAGIIFGSKKIPKTFLLLYLALCFLFIIFVNIDVPGLSEITLKMGVLSYVILLIFAAGFFDDRRFSTTALCIALTIMLLPALVTFAMDWYNNQDVWNTKFTSVISREDQEVYDWMQTNLEKDACVQSTPGDEGFLEGYVTEIPALARRPVYLGDKVHSRLYQISKEEVQYRDKIVTKIFNSYSAGQISALAQRAGINYFFVSSQENLNPFEERIRGPFFHLIRSEQNAGLYRVVKKTPNALELEPHILYQDEETGEVILRVEYTDGFFHPEVLEDFYTFRWMNSYGKLILISNQRLRGNLSFGLYSEPYRRYVSLFLDGRSMGQERAKIRGMPVNLVIGLHKGRNILEFREPETYPGKKPPTEEDRTGKIFKVEQLQFTPIEDESTSGN